MHRTRNECSAHSNGLLLMFLDVLQVVGLWFMLSVSGLVASVNPSKADKTVLATSLEPSYRDGREYNGDSSAGGGSGSSGGSGGGVGNSYSQRPYDRPQTRCISCLYTAMTGSQDRDR